MGRDRAGTIHDVPHWIDDEGGPATSSSGWISGFPWSRRTTAVGSLVPLGEAGAPASRSRGGGRRSSARRRKVRPELQRAVAEAT
jgi:hypothetical protein